MRFSKRANDAIGGSDPAVQAGRASAAVAVAAADPPVAAPRSRPLLGELIVEAGIADKAAVEDAVREGQETGERLGEVVVRRGWATDDQIAQLLSKQWQLPCIPRSAMAFDPDALREMSQKQALELEAIPFRVENERVVVAVAEPTEARLAAIRRVVGEDVAITVVPRGALEAALRSEVLFPGARATEAPANAPPAVALVSDDRPEPEPQLEARGPLPLRPEQHASFASVERRPASAGDPVIAALETAQGQMTAAVSALVALAESIAAGAQELASLQQRLETSEAAREDDATTIARLRRELEERSRTAAAMHTKLLELTEIVAASATDS